MIDENIPFTRLTDEEAAARQHCEGGCGSGCGGGNCSSCNASGSCLRGIAMEGWSRSDRQLNTFDYRADIPGNDELTDLVEVQFKNTRKAYYRNDNRLPLVKGDMVAVESSPGHDVGTVTLTGSLVLLQIAKAGVNRNEEFKRIYRKVRPADIEKYEEAKAREQQTMIRSRQIAKDLDLKMKIGDVEYQGDGQKAIFYYISDQRVDFRKLIRVLADTFHIRVEMRQIGARQEAGRIGGFGPCGRELCCSTWMKNFSSVSTAAARFQDLSSNPQKLAGQCAKLKCCLNYEVDQYLEAQKRLPSKDVHLETADGTYYFFKADILSGMVSYSTDKRLAANIVTIPAERAFEIIKMNRNGEKPESLGTAEVAAPARPVDLVEQESLTRFDKSRRNNRRRPNREGGDRGNDRRVGNRERGERGERRNNRERGERGARSDRQGRPQPRAGENPPAGNAPRTET